MNKLLIIFIALTLFSTGCKKDDDANIPLVSVDIYINLSNPEYIHLKVDNGWTEVTGGSRGIIVYRTNGSYKAYDKHCTYKVTNSCGLVTVDVTNITGVDACCGSKFLMSTGQPTQGPATQKLKEYSNSLDGTILHIYN